MCALSLSGAIEGLPCVFPLRHLQGSAPYGTLQIVCRDYYLSGASRRSPGTETGFIYVTANKVVGKNIHLPLMYWILCHSYMSANTHVHEATKRNVRRAQQAPQMGAIHADSIILVRHMAATPAGLQLIAAYILYKPDRTSVDVGISPPFQQRGVASRLCIHHLIDNWNVQAGIKAA